MGTIFARLSKLWHRHVLMSCFIVVAVVLLVFYCSPGSLETRVKWAGIVFELLGIAVVAIGLSGTNELLGGRSFGKWLASLFGNVLPQHVVLEAAAASIAVSGGNVRVRTTGLSVEQKIEKLEERCEALEDEIHMLRDADRVLRREMKELVAEEEKKRRADDARIEDQLKASMVGSVGLDLAGLGFLVLGVLLANGSTEFAAMFASLGVT
jgi:hypothetical protein